jgi:hypothetical protein
MGGRVLCVCAAMARSFISPSRSATAVFICVRRGRAELATPVPSLRHLLRSLI